jgi:hypothetical protein
MLRHAGRTISLALLLSVAVGVTVHAHGDVIINWNNVYIENIRITGGPPCPIARRKEPRVMYGTCTPDAQVLIASPHRLRSREAAAAKRALVRRPSTPARALDAELSTRSMRPIA